MQALSETMSAETMSMSFATPVRALERSDTTSVFPISSEPAEPTKPKRQSKADKPPAKPRAKKAVKAVAEPVAEPLPHKGGSQMRSALLGGSLSAAPDPAACVYSSLEDYDEQVYRLIESYFEGNHTERLVRHQLESYNDFVSIQLQKTIQMFNPVRIRSENDFVRETGLYILEIVIQFENLKLHPPTIHENNGATKRMMPQEAKIRNITYASNMTVDLDIQYIVRRTENMDEPVVHRKLVPSISIGKMPIMLKSCICELYTNRIQSDLTGECKMDCGGYFIIKGSEKTVLGQERTAENKIYCFDGKNTTKWSWIAEIKSVPDYKCISPKQVEMMISNKSNGSGHGIFVAIPRVKAPIELFVLFRALGVISDRDICSHIVLDVDAAETNPVMDFLVGSILDANRYMTQEDAFAHIVANVSYVPMNMDKETGAKKKRDFTQEVLNNDLFPHCSTQQQKIFLLGYMASKLIGTQFGWIPQDDRDSYLNKRIELTGTLLNNLFRNYFNKLVKEMQKLVLREVNTSSWRSTQEYGEIINMTNIYKIIKPATIENGINRALATGDFSIKQMNSTKVGVAQVLNRLTYPATLSHMRRINTPLEKCGELIPPRKLHNTTWGFLCPVETPEGQSIGVVKNIAYLTHITIPCSTTGLYAAVDPYLDYRIGSMTRGIASMWRKVKVFVNGCWLGATDRPLELYRELKQKKHQGILSIYTAIHWNYRAMEICVCSDGGRLVRPLLRMSDDGKRLLLTNDVLARLSSDDPSTKIGWNDLLIQGVLDESVIEYIDPEEQNGAMVAMKSKQSLDLSNPLQKRFTHAEIHPSTIFGILASCIPFPEHNQAPRNTYQTAMGKQAMGIYATNYDKRMDKTGYILTYPSRPLVETRLMNFIELNRTPSGCQIHVAIMTHTGYNQEDSVLINKGSLDRGLFLATIFHTEKDEDKNLVRDEIIRCKPEKARTKGMKFGNYDKLDNKGFVPRNTLIENRDVIIAKMTPIKEHRNDPTKVIKYEDQSKVFRTTEETYVDKNITGRNGEGYNFAKVRTRILRTPVIGDKFASRAGQKGTLGNIIPECDMPYTASGMKPDLILNPHAIPSRMTIAQLKETLLGKVLLELGMFGDATAFNDFSIESIREYLSNLGYESCGNEIMYDGQTGEQMETSIFLGPVFYQRLKHMVLDKQHSRSIGPMVSLTRQPAEGRCRDGGFRIGEMERDVMIAHGMSQLTKERLYDVSDKYAVWVCKSCGLVAAFNDGTRRAPDCLEGMTVHHCRTCDNRTEFAQVEVPYTYKLLSQELQTINVVPRFVVEPI
jgi:DNA-directed RNA polymerase II subunit RPB2